MMTTLASTDRDTRVIFAVHPDWAGNVTLSGADRVASIAEHGSRGRYEFDGSKAVTIHWDRFSAERFLDVHGVWIQEGLLGGSTYLERLHDVVVAGRAIRATEVTLAIPGFDYRVSLRLGTSDIPTFEQVFVRSEYASRNLPDTAATIVDLGANVGLASVFFGLRYPDAEILALEASGENYVQLLKNVGDMAGRVQAVEGAAWHVGGTVNLLTTTVAGEDLGNWGFQVSDAPGIGSVRALDMRDVMRLSGFAKIDILKVDIEGAELEVFSAPDLGWLDDVRLVIVETHDRFRPGTEDAVRGALARDFVELEPNGENLFFRRR